MSEVISYITPEYFIDIYQVRRYNAEVIGRSASTMTFNRGYNLRQNGWVVDFRHKNNVSTGQKLFNNKIEAIQFIENKMVIA
jgi:hypothetical protein